MCQPTKSGFESEVCSRGRQPVYFPQYDPGRGDCRQFGFQGR